MTKFYLLHLFKKIIILIFAVVMIAACSSKSNWPNFRGPNSNQLTTEKKLPMEWGETHNLSWKYELNGKGWCSPIIWGNKVFFTKSSLDDPSRLPLPEEGNRPENPMDAVYNLEVICLDLETGAELWKKVAYNGLPRYRTHRDNSYAPETMVTDGTHVYAYFGMTGLYCYDMNGNLVWEKDLGNYPMLNGWGTSSSPLLFNNVLYMQIDNEENSFLAALDSKSGKELWRVARDEKSTWGTPVIWKNSQRTELVTQGSKALSYNPDNGELLWKLDLDGGRTITSPVANGDMLYMGNNSRRDGGETLFCVKAGASGDISLKEGERANDFVVWSVPKSGIAMSSPLYYKGFIYIAARRGGKLYCYDANTGELVYPAATMTDAKDFWASPWAFNNHIYCLDAEGTTHIIQAGREFKEVGKNKLDDIFWASTAIANGSYVFKGEKAVYCIR